MAPPIVSAREEGNNVPARPGSALEGAGAVLPGAACAGLAAWGVVAWGERPAPWLLAGGVLYLAGAIAVTIAANVPLNDALAATRPAAPAPPTDDAVTSAAGRHGITCAPSPRSPRPGCSSWRSSWAEAGIG
jgi:hypothetical protein